jgi:hypothetical protein
VCNTLSKRSYIVINLSVGSEIKMMGIQAARHRYTQDDGLLSLLTRVT